MIVILKINGNSYNHVLGLLLFFFFFFLLLFFFPAQESTGVAAPSTIRVIYPELFP